MQVKLNLLPPDCFEYPYSISTQNLGTLILNESDLSVIGVPSSVVHEEWNFLLNPRNMPAGWPVILDMDNLRYDIRIKQ